VGDAGGQGHGEDDATEHVKHVERATIESV
jgi:hypothetical protein